MLNSDQNSLAANGQQTLLTSAQGALPPPITPIPSLPWNPQSLDRQESGTQVGETANRGGVLGSGTKASELLPTKENGSEAGGGEQDLSGASNRLLPSGGINNGGQAAAGSAGPSNGGGGRGAQVDFSNEGENERRGHKVLFY